MIPKVAIGCSGLGRVRRGNKTWAYELAEALDADGEPVTLLGNGPLRTACPYSRLPALPREHLLWLRRYQLEQFVFARSLLRWLRAGWHDIVHVADPQLVWWVRDRTRGGQVALSYREDGAARGADVSGWQVILHFVGTAWCAPCSETSGLRCTTSMEGVPAGAFVVLAVGDLAGRSQKRLDRVVQEVATLLDGHLVVAGQAMPLDVAAFERMARPLRGSRRHLRPNVPPPQMAALFLEADIFAHAALREPSGLVFLQAMASGLPVGAHTLPVPRWIVGAAGETVDMETAGALTAVLGRWQARPQERSEVTGRAPRRPVEVFAPVGILPSYRWMYTGICSGA